MHDSMSHAARTTDTTSTTNPTTHSTTTKTRRPMRRLPAVTAAVIAAGALLPATGIASDSSSTGTVDINALSAMAEQETTTAAIQGTASAAAELDDPVRTATDPARTAGDSARVSRSGDDRPSLEGYAFEVSDKTEATPATANRARKRVSAKVPARGKWHRHSSGYSWARWAGDINVAGSRDHGNPVRSVGSGRVKKVKRWNYSYGHHVVIGDKLYAHLSRITVRKGQRVRHGQMIGRVGSTGNSSGPHLHFETGRR